MSGIKVEIKILGAQEAQQIIEQKIRNASQNVSIEIAKASMFMQGEVKESIAGQRSEPTSVDTGRFLNSVDIRTFEKEGLIFTDVDYAKHLEYGTSRVAPRYHFKNSLNRNEEKVIEIMKEAVKNI